jgi:hypothetical protein
VNGGAVVAGPQWIELVGSSGEPTDSDDDMISGTEVELEESCLAVAVSVL